MISLSIYINDLLRQYDCVIIPGFGGFIANYSSSILNREKGIVYPPSKGIIFNKNLNRNDGLLANEIATRTNTEYAEVLSTLETLVIKAFVDLQKGGRIEFTGIGYLYFDNERNIQFLAHQTNNFLNSSYGLKPVQANPIKRKIVETIGKIEPLIVPIVKKEAEKIEEKTVLEEKIFPVKKEAPVKLKTRYIAAAAVFIPILFYAYWIPFQTPALKSGHFELGYLNPFKEYPKPFYSARLNDKVELLRVNSDSINASFNNDDYSLNSGESQENLSIPESTYVQPTLDTEAKHFHIIVGCFLNPGNATTQISTLSDQGLKPYSLGFANGFHRVALGSYSTKTEAINALNDYRSKGQPNAWLLFE